MKLITVGMGLATIAAAAAIWQATSKGGLFRAPGYVCIGVLVAGLLLAVIGLFQRDDDQRPNMTQVGGDHSVQQQAGRDINDRRRP